MADQVADKITFSIEGLTLRGFFLHKHKWVPFKGQTLQCKRTDDGPLSAFLGTENVGNVQWEVSRNFKQWLKDGGNLEARVNGNPKVHRNKGGEVPVVYLFTGDNKPVLRNMRNAIELDINKKSKRKKCLKFHHGAITDEVSQAITDGIICGTGEEGSTQTKAFSVSGMCLRGFHIYREDWVPEIGSKHVCFVSQQGAVAAKFEENVCGHVPTDSQKLWRQFMKEGGNITAVVSGPPKRHRSKGEEVPVIYVFTATWTSVLLNLRVQIITDIKKKMKRKKSLRVDAGDITCTIVPMKSAPTLQQPDADSDIENIDERQEEKSEGKLSPSSSSRKRGLERCDDALDSAKKKKTKEVSNKADKIRTLEEDYKIGLTEKDDSRVSQLISKHWELLGYVLGLRKTDISMLLMKCNNAADSGTICNMFLRWGEIKPDKATLGHLIEAVNKCPRLEIDKQEFKKFISEKRNTLNIAQ